MSELTPRIQMVDLQDPGGTAILASPPIAVQGLNYEGFVALRIQAAGAAFRHDLKCYASGKMPATYVNGLNSTLHFMSIWHQEGGAKRLVQIYAATKARMRFVGHHLAHTLSAYAYSGFDDAAVVVMDGRGAWEAASIWHGRDGRLEHVLTIPFPDSVGYFYSEFTECLGFQRNSDEWKVMGLAPYGKPGVDLHAFIEPEAAPYKVHARKLVANEAAQFAEMCGCSGRDGSLDGGGRLQMKAMRHAYLGPEFDDGAIESVLKTYKLKYARLNDVASAAAELLSNEKIVGWFQGRMEFGLRALGSRSILADPRDPEMNAEVNNAVKFREWWWPFAPSMKKEAVGEYLESASDSPFMILTAQVRPENAR
jgi:predicted NodU family carbamoyl transferase